MAAHSTHKSGTKGKAATLAKRQGRALKSANLNLNRSARAKREA